jgi:hypothetical protein
VGRIGVEQADQEREEADARRKEKREEKRRERAETARRQDEAEAAEGKRRKEEEAEQRANRLLAVDEPSDYSPSPASRSIPLPTPTFLASAQQQSERLEEDDQHDSLLVPPHQSLLAHSRSFDSVVSSSDYGDGSSAILEQEPERETGAMLKGSSEEREKAGLEAFAFGGRRMTGDDERARGDDDGGSSDEGSGYMPSSPDGDGPTEGEGGEGGYAQMSDDGHEEGGEVYAKLEEGSDEKQSDYGSEEREEGSGSEREELDDDAEDGSSRLGDGEDPLGDVFPSEEVEWREIRQAREDRQGEAGGLALTGLELSGDLPAEENEDGIGHVDLDTQEVLDLLASHRTSLSPRPAGSPEDGTMEHLQQPDRSIPPSNSTSSFASSIMGDPRISLSSFPLPPPSPLLPRSGPSLTADFDSPRPQADGERPSAPTPHAAASHSSTFLTAAATLPSPPLLSSSFSLDPDSSLEHSFETPTQADISSFSNPHGDEANIPSLAAAPPSSAVAGSTPFSRGRRGTLSNPNNLTLASPISLPRSSLTPGSQQGPIPTLPVIVASPLTSGSSSPLPPAGYQKQRSEVGSEGILSPGLSESSGGGLAYLQGRGGKEGGGPRRVDEEVEEDSDADSASTGGMSAAFNGAFRDDDDDDRRGSAYLMQDSLDDLEDGKLLYSFSSCVAR